MDTIRPVVTQIAEKFWKKIYTYTVPTILRWYKLICGKVHWNADLHARHTYGNTCVANNTSTACNLQQVLSNLLIILQQKFYSRYNAMFAVQTVLIGNVSSFRLQFVVWDRKNLGYRLYSIVLWLYLGLRYILKSHHFM